MKWTWDTKPDWSGIHSLEPDAGSIDFKSDNYEKLPTKVEITIRQDSERYEAAKQYLAAHHIPYEATGFSRGASPITSKGTITIHGGDAESPESPARKLYALITDAITDQEEPHTLDERTPARYVAANLYGRVFGSLLVHPPSRLMDIGQHDPKIQAHLQPIHALDPERTLTLVEAFLEVDAKARPGAFRQSGR